MLGHTITISYYYISVPKKCINTLAIDGVLKGAHIRGYTTTRCNGSVDIVASRATSGMKEVVHIKGISFHKVVHGCAHVAVLLLSEMHNVNVSFSHHGVILLSTRPVHTRFYCHTRYILIQK